MNLKELEAFCEKYNLSDEKYKTKAWLPLLRFISDETYFNINLMVKKLKENDFTKGNKALLKQCEKKRYFKVRGLVFPSTGFFTNLLSGKKELVTISVEYDKKEGFFSIESCEVSNPYLVSEKLAFYYETMEEVSLGYDLRNWPTHFVQLKLDRDYHWSKLNTKINPGSMKPNQVKLNVLNIKSCAEEPKDRRSYTQSKLFEESISSLRKINPKLSKRQLSEIAKLKND